MRGDSGYCGGFPLLGLRLMAVVAGGSYSPSHQQPSTAINRPNRQSIGPVETGFEIGGYH